MPHRPHLALALLLAATLAHAQNPVPHLSTVQPTAVAPGSGAFTLTVYGANFVPGAVVNWNYQPRSTTFVSARKLQAQILATDVATNTAGTITVTNPPPGGGNSSSSYAQVEVHSPTATIVPGNPYPGPIQYPYGGGPTILADFTNNNILDLVYGGVSAVGLGNGTFKFSQILRNFHSPAGIVYGDFNGDGNLDVAYTAGDSASYLPGQQIQVQLGNGAGKFSLASEIQSYENQIGFGALVAGDFNGDGVLDLVVLKDFAITVYLGRGDGTFAQRFVYLFPGSGEGETLQVGDFNGDGKLDLIGMDSETGGLYVILGNGDGTFQVPAITVTASGMVGCQGDGQNVVVLDDFNGDGNLDVLACTSLHKVQVFLGNGDGTFQQPLIYSVNPLSDFFLVQGDFNSDGKTDLIITQFGGSVSQFSIALGNGDGTFQPQQVVKLPGKIAYTGERGVAAADLNADGLLDFILVDAGGLDVIYVQK